MASNIPAHSSRLSDCCVTSELLCNMPVAKHYTCWTPFPSCEEFTFLIYQKYPTDRQACCWNILSLYYRLEVSLPLLTKPKHTQQITNPPVSRSQGIRHYSLSIQHIYMYKVSSLRPASSAGPLSNPGVPRRSTSGNAGAYPSPTTPGPSLARLFF